MISVLKQIVFFFKIKSKLIDGKPSLTLKVCDN